MHFFLNIPITHWTHDKVHHIQKTSYKKALIYEEKRYKRRATKDALQARLYTDNDNRGLVPGIVSFRIEQCNAKNGTAGRSARCFLHPDTAFASLDLAVSSQFSQNLLNLY